jgi:hypothetical protein
MSDDLQWRRPVGPDPMAGRFPEPGIDVPAVPEYAGPPRATPPPSDWRPRTLIQVPAPRVLPEQDLTALDAEEKSARTTTYGVGMIAGAVVLVLLFVLCGRALF